MGVGFSILHESVHFNSLKQIFRTEYWNCSSMYPYIESYVRIILSTSEFQIFAVIDLVVRLERQPNLNGLHGKCRKLLLKFFRYFKISVTQITEWIQFQVILRVIIRLDHSQRIMTYRIYPEEEQLSKTLQLRGPLTQFNNQIRSWSASLNHFIFVK